MIPLGCCKSAYFSNEYLKSYECKLLGLNNEVNLFSESSSGLRNDQPMNLNVCDDLNEFILVDLVVDLSQEQNLTIESNITHFIKFNVYTNVKQIDQGIFFKLRLN